VFADAWLAEISADLREAVAHLRRDATMRYTNTPPLYFTFFGITIAMSDDDDD